LSKFQGGFASKSQLPAIDGVNVQVGDQAFTVDDGGYWSVAQPAAPPGANPVWAFMASLYGPPGPQGAAGFGEPGPAGQIGPQGPSGPRGPQGLAGKNSFSQISQPLTMPPVGQQPVGLPVTDTSWMTPGLLTFVPGLGTLTVVGSPPGPNTVNLVNSGDPNNAAPGTTVQAGTTIAPAHMRGPGGAQGPPGPQGPAGPQGVSGSSVYSTLTQTLTVPPVGQTVTAFVVTAAPFAVGQIVYVAGTPAGEYFSVQAVTPANNTLTLINQGYPGGAPPGTVLAVGATVSGTGPQGPQGIQGVQGVQGPQGLVGVAPTGSVIMWPTPTPPGGYLICDGSIVARAQYPNLFAVISTTFNTGGEDAASFRLPDFRGRFPLGVSSSYAMASTGGEATHTLLLTELAAHAHAITDLTHTHPDNSHTHGGSYLPSHGHGTNEQPHSHSYVNPLGALGLPSQAGNALYVPSGPAATGTAVTNLSVVAAPNLGLVIPAAAANLGAQYTGLTTTQSQGGGQPHQNMPPYLSLNFAIKT
jgi:microcystin-dependent protein